MILRRRSTGLVVVLLLLVLATLLFLESGRSKGLSPAEARILEPADLLRAGGQDEQLAIAAFPDEGTQVMVEPRQTASFEESAEGAGTENVEPDKDDVDSHAIADEDKDEAHGIQHRELFSLTTRSRKFSIIFWSGQEAYNPNIIPHPTRHDIWIVVAQRRVSSGGPGTDEEVVCEASFINDALICESEPAVLPIAPAIHPGMCQGDIAGYDMHVGPKDARVFYGPDGPLVLYGSQSMQTCFGIWIQDARMLLDAFSLGRFALSTTFAVATEIQRPGSYAPLEKNFFLFWDLEGKTYVHHDVYPERVFAQLEIDGSVGPNLAGESAYEDAMCMARFLPQIQDPDSEFLHQATNSLSVTMCKRDDPSCAPSADNTFVLHIFHHKSYHSYHAVYEPYVVLFRQEAPFALHAISQRPLWIAGRGNLTPESPSALYRQRPAEDIPQGHTEMFYVTSVSWKGHAHRYHGYLDDVVFLAFGIEDTQSGVIDVKVADLLQDLALC